MVATALITMAFAYLLGSVNFAVIFIKLFKRRDVRDYGSGNAGTTNAMRVGGFLPGTLTFICDALKGFIASGVGYLLFEYIGKNSDAFYGNGLYGAYICGLICIIGHLFPLFFEFKGGKGVATAVGIYAVCCPYAIIIGLAVFGILLLASKYVSLSSVISAGVVFVMSLVFCNTESASFWVQTIISAVICIIIIIKHKDNIKRLMAGEERKIGKRNL